MRLKIISVENATIPNYNLKFIPNKLNVFIIHAPDNRLENSNTNNNQSNVLSKILYIIIHSF